MTLGETISYLRERRGMSQTALAKKLNIATSTLGMWETDRRKPNPDALVQIADFFGVTTDYLLGRKVDDGLRVAAHLSDDFDSLPEAQKREVREYIKFKTAQYRKEQQDKGD